jgi:hypothetical protein
VEEGQQISHGLGIGLEAGHGGRAAADNLLDELTIVFALNHTVKIGTHESLGGKTMAPGAIQAKQAAAVARIARQLEGGPGVGITVEAWQQHHQTEDQDGHSGHQRQQGEETSAPRWLLPRWRQGAGGSSSKG